MNIKTRLAVALGTLLLPAFAWAAAPGSVTNIHGTLRNGKVTVTWDAPSGGPVSAYRIFFSHASILANSGLYDDFEAAAGSVTSYTLQNVPPVQTLYISVLAVNAAGEESPYFAEEASVDMGGNSSSASSVQTSGSVLRLLSAVSTSSTGVLLTFSTPVTVDAAKALSAFTIQSASGTVLPVVSVSSQGMTVTITTAPQLTNTVYEVTVGNGVTGNTTNGTSIPYDTTQGPTLFTSATSGAAASRSSSSAQSIVSDVTNLVLRARLEKANVYTVEASWTAPNSGTIANYQVLQSTDGTTFGAVKTIDKDAAGIAIAHIPSGTFTLLVRAVGNDGSLTQGVTQSIPLPVTQKVTKPSQPTGNTSKDMEHVPTDSNLPQSGPSLWIAIAMAGAVAGYRVMKKKEVAA